MPPHHRRTPAQRRRRQHTKLNPRQLGRTLKQRKAIGLVVVLFLIIAVAVLDRGVNLLPVGDDWHRYHEQRFEVLRVIDGDTIDLRSPDGDRKPTRVRLWGVDTPEMGSTERDTPPEPFAVEATEFTTLATKGEHVRVHLQRHRLRDRYGRLLAYIELPDGRILNAELIENGLSEHDDRWGHDHAEHYGRLERQAREARKGIWGQ